MRRERRCCLYRCPPCTKELCRQKIWWVWTPCPEIDQRSLIENWPIAFEQFDQSTNAIDQFFFRPKFWIVFWHHGHIALEEPRFTEFVNEISMKIVQHYLYIIYDSINPSRVHTKKVRKLLGRIMYIYIYIYA